VKEIIQRDKYLEYKEGNLRREEGCTEREDGDGGGGGKQIF